MKNILNTHLLSVLTFVCQISFSQSEPTDAPSEPISVPAGVVSLYSDTYNDINAVWNPDQSTNTTVIEDVVIANNNIKKYTNFNFSSIDLTANTVDISSFTHFRLDFWTSSIQGASQIKVKLVDYGTDNVSDENTDIEVERTKFIMPAEQGGWNTLEIPISNFQDNGLTTYANIGQVVLSASSWTPGNPTVYLDNIYFVNADLEQVNVTFSVNMSEVETNPGGVHLGGGNFGGNPGHLMSDEDGDDVWAITLPANPGDSITYKFVNGPIAADWSANWETLPLGCIENDNGDRGFAVPATDVQIPTVCFSSCIDCIVEIPPLVLNDFSISGDAANQGAGAQWIQYDETANGNNFTYLSQVTSQDLSSLDSPAMLADYSIFGHESWGGYSGVFDIFENVADLSSYNYLSFKFYNQSPPIGGGSQSISFRAILWDISDVSGEYNSREDVETWWAFFAGDESPFTNDVSDGWVEYRIPLVDNGSTAQAGYRDGFSTFGSSEGVSIFGNDSLNLDKIGGIGIEIVAGGADNTTSGQFLIDDIQAIYSPDIPGCTDVNACNFDSVATYDDGTCYSCVEVTFNLDMSSVSDYTQNDQPYLAGGSFFGVPGNPDWAMNYNELLSTDGSLIFSKTVQIKENTSIDYTYTKDGNEWWSTKESIGGQSCAVDPHSDRRIITTTQDTVINACFSNCTENAFCSEVVTVDLTFAVDMSDVDVNPAGVYIGGGNFAGNPGHLMSDIDEDDIWTITLPAPPNSQWRYKFVNGPISANWSASWEEVPSECSVGDGNDRGISVPEVDTVLDTVCFAKCEGCIENYPLDVTFNVDMSGVSGFDPSEPPYVFGSYNLWDNFQGYTILSDNNGDNIYSGTVSGFMFNDSVTYLFGHNAPTYEGIEIVPAICGVGDPEIELYVRELPLRLADGDSLLVLDTISFSQCPVDNSPKARLAVDVNSMIDVWPDTVKLCVVGSFNGWVGPNAACYAEMFDEDGDNIYETIISGLTAGSDYEFKFLANQGWDNPDFESGAPLGSNCDFNPTDSFTNYGFTAIDGTLDLGVFQWNGCNTLSNTYEHLLPTEFTFKAYPNPFNPYVSINYELPKTEKVAIDIVNILGQNVKTLVNSVQIPGSYTYTWDGKNSDGMILNSGMYFAIISRESGRNILKITYLK